MTLYHGTIGNRGEKITQYGRIKHDAPIMCDKDILFVVVLIFMLIDATTRPENIKVQIQEISLVALKEDINPAPAYEKDDAFIPIMDRYLDYDPSAESSVIFFNRFKIKCIGRRIGILQLRLFMREQMPKKNICG